MRGPERLQKLIARAGLTSRRKAEDWIAAGRVQINGQVASLGDRADSSRDRILVDGAPLGASENQVTVLLNKPRGYVSSLKDPQGRRLVTDLVADLDQRLFPVGRLDYNTEGLLLLTNDGQLAQQLAHPRHHVDKTYLVKVRGCLSKSARVAMVRVQDKTSWFELTLREGRNRQVRRMCAAVGLPVTRLKRIGLGFLTLGDLAPGQYRLLSREEVRRLKGF